VQDAAYRAAMILVTQSEILELVEELRGMAAAAPTAKVRDALTRMADRYAARLLTPAAHACLTMGHAALRATRATPVSLHPQQMGSAASAPHDVIDHELRDWRES
jgi:hypothetical protein